MSRERAVLELVRTALVIAPHPDDEVLGCGGTARRYVLAGARVTVAIVIIGTPLYPESQVRQVRTEAAKAAGLDRKTLHGLLAKYGIKTS